MTQVPLYVYTRFGGGLTVSPVKPDVEHTQMIRLVAGDGMELVKDGVRTVCIDAVNADGWSEEVALCE